MISLENINLKLGSRCLKINEKCIFPNGSVTFIKGESGVGKTTLLYILAMLSKQTEYEYYYNGRLVNKQAERESIRKSEIGMLYQNFNMLEDLSLYQNLKLFSDINSVSFNEEKAIKILNLFNLKLTLDRSFKSLSGGEKQRFCLACILLKNPSVIIADEPTSALDQSNAKQLMDLLYMLAKDYNKTIIVSTHSSEFDHLADNIITLYRDKITQKNRYHEDEPEIKVKFRALNRSFYYDMSKFRIKRMFKKSNIVISLMIVMLSLSNFLLNYSYSSEKEYAYYLNNSLENEVFVIPKNDDIDLSKEEISTIKSIPNINNIYPVFKKFGKLTINGEDKGFIEVYPVYSFQNKFGNNGCAVDSLLYDCLDKNIELEIAGSKYDLFVESVYSLDKSQMYSTDTLGKVFIPYELLSHLEGNESNKYVLEIDSFLEYENIVKKFSAVNDGYLLQSSYQFFSSLLRNARQQQLFINIGSAILTLISTVLFITVQVHEVRDKRKEMCIFQANGLNKKHVFSLEIVENIFKFIIFVIVSTVVSYGLVISANHFILKDISMSMDVRYLLTLLILLVFTIIIPGLVAAFYMIRQSPEDELRALF